MSIVDDFIKGVVDAVVREVQGKRARRRTRRLTPTERLKQIEKLIRPAQKQTSRKKTVRTRSTAQQTRVRTRTQKHTKSLRTGKARR